MSKAKKKEELPAPVISPEGEKRLKRLFNDIHHAQKRKWLAAIAVCGRINESGRLSGIDPTMHYIWMRKDPDYPQAFEEARSIACDAAEDEIFRRGITGIDHPLSFKGKLTGDVIKQYSDLLAIFWMKGARPEKYRDDARLQINVNVPPAINIVSAIDVTDASRALDHDTPESEKALKV